MSSKCSNVHLYNIMYAVRTTVIDMVAYTTKSCEFKIGLITYHLIYVRSETSALYMVES